MSDWEEFVIWVSLVGSAVSALGCSYAAWKLVNWHSGALFRFSLILSATMAIAYCLSYGWLLSHPDQVVQWSRVMRPVGMMSWLIGPWTALPLALIRQVVKLTTTMRQKADEVLAEVRDTRAA